jgi:hypothetical protein
MRIGLVDVFVDDQDREPRTRLLGGRIRIVELRKRRVRGPRA